LLACHWRSQARDAQFLRAARYSDGIISISDTPDEYKQVVEQVNSVAADLGREPTQMEKVFYLTVNMNEDTAHAESEATDWLTRYYGSDIWGTRWGPFGGPERVAQRMAEYVEAGADTLVVRFASFQPQRQLEIFLDRVAPAFM
jgi:alkanesulfonate monooxygenase SsuD/methylene tetrahydromethanopterin reductase-like flavin-dependent oxidoreductase (luciferase family)